MLSRILNYARRTLAYSFRYATASVDRLDDRPAELTGTNRDYRRFVVVGHQRSGSTMLMDALGANPEITAYGELFVSAFVGFNTPGYDNNSATLRALRDRYPLEFLDRLVFAGYPETTGAVGFKLFPEQLSSRRYEPVRRRLQSDTGLVVIHLQRKDLLAAFASLQVALADNRYSINDASKRSATTVRPSAADCEAYFEERRRSSEAIENMFGDHAVYDLTYEELAADPVAESLRVQEHLGVTPTEPQISTVKQEVRPLSEVLENFEELRGHFAGTPYAHLFDSR